MSRPVPAAAAALTVAAAILAGCSTPPPRGETVRQVSVTAVPVADPAPSLDSQVLQLARQFVYRARNVDCLATGTAFFSSGSLVTNRHVAAGAHKLQLATWDGSDFVGAVAGHSGNEDLAQVDAVPPYEQFAPLAPSDPGPGQPVWVAGYPLGDQLTVTEGKVIRSLPGRQFGLGGSVLEISNAVQPGNSGSPLLDSSGEVVGVVFAYDTRDKDGLAMPVSQLRSFQNGSPDPAALPCAE